MSARGGAALYLVAAALFLVANRDAYRGYFQDDELDNLSWTRAIPISEYARQAVNPRFLPNNFRPAGHFYFREMSLHAGLDFAAYLPVLHLAHLVNLWLVWSIARGLGFEPFPAAFGSLLFGLHMACFDIYWKPMYVFDLFCATFSLLAIWLYMRRRYALSFCAFWLAYKSKELAVMLPAVLACYELLLAKERNWKRLIPFVSVSVLFGAQALALNAKADEAYTFHFTPSVFWHCLRFYAARLFPAPDAGLALAILPFAIRGRKIWFGAAALLLFFLPLLFLPGRLFAAYCYLPLAGLAWMAAAFAARPRLRPVAGLLAIAWIAWNLAGLNKLRRETLAQDGAVYAYVSELARFAGRPHAPKVFVYDGAPEHFHDWGIRGALRLLYQEPDVRVLAIEDLDAPQALERGAARLVWNPDDKRLSVIGFEVP